jgi:hypothetical protein
MPEACEANAGLLEKVADFYHNGLKGARKTSAWLKRRQLDQEDLIVQFRLGAATGRLLKTLPLERVFGVTSSLFTFSLEAFERQPNGPIATGLELKSFDSHGYRGVIQSARLLSNLRQLQPAVPSRSPQNKVPPPIAMTVPEIDPFLPFDPLHLLDNLLKSECRPQYVPSATFAVYLDSS